tara:strand:+ start:241 stop:843 length:603 start_codon:yes stop_codon:yes gene_type:complete
MRGNFKTNKRWNKMKFRILDEQTIEYLIDFLDDIQLQAAEEQDNILLNFCQDMINELINADEVFDNEDEAIKRLKEHKRKNYKVDETDLDEDMLKKIYDYFDQIKNYTDNPNKDNLRKKGKEKRKKQNKKETKVKKNIITKMSLPEIEQFLLDDPELTDNERFELYYEERERIRQENELKNGLSYEELLKQSGIQINKKK